MENIITKPVVELKNDLKQTYFKATIIENGNYLHVEWQGYAVTLPEIMNGVNAEISLFNEYKLTALLSDHTKVYGSWKHANEWIEKHALSELIKAGLKSYAQVLSKDVFAQLSSDELKLIFEKEFTVKFFKDMASAKKWIVN